MQLFENDAIIVTSLKTKIQIIWSLYLPNFFLINYFFEFLSQNENCVMTLAPNFEQNNNAILFANDEIIGTSLKQWYKLWDSFISEWSYSFLDHCGAKVIVYVGCQSIYKVCTLKTQINLVLFLFLGRLGRVRANTDLQFG